jgi:serine/threonine protein kinase
MTSRCCAIREHGVIHRDIKPSNIFVFAPDVVKLFGVGSVHLDSGCPLVPESGDVFKFPLCPTYGTAEYWLLTSTRHCG